MKKIVNNPKTMIVCSIILLFVSFVIMQVSYSNFINNCIEFVLYGNFILLIYFLLIIFKTKYININLMNNILLVNYVVVLLIYIYNSIIKDLLHHFIVITFLPMTITRILLYIAIIITLIIIFFSKTKSIIKPNIFTTILMIFYVISLCGEIHYTSVYGITTLNFILYKVLTTIYYVPMFLYFRLYALHKSRKGDK